MKSSALTVSKPVIVTSLVLLALAGLSIPAMDWFETYDQAIATEQDKVRQLLTIRKEQLAVNKAQADLERTWTLRTDSRLQAELDEVVTKLELRSHVQAFRPAGTTQAGPLEEILMELTVTDMTQQQSVELLQALEAMPSPLRVKSLTWRRHTNSAHTQELSIMIAAYQRNTQPPTAP